VTWCDDVVTLSQRHKYVLHARSFERRRPGAGYRHLNQPDQRHLLTGTRMWQS
jgi:hypothetical protein